MNTVTFYRKNLILDLTFSEKYVKKQIGNDLLINRRNLIIDIFFLTKAWDSLVIKNPIVLYIGNVDKNNIIFLARLFENVKFHVFDEKLSISNRDKIDNIEVFKNKNEISKYKNNEQLFIIHKGLDMDDQKKIYEELNPSQPSLFMLDFEKFKPDDLYMKGIVFLPPWSPRYSYLTALIINPDSEMVKWDVDSNMNSLYYHNEYIKNIDNVYYNVLNGSSEIISKDLGLGRDFSAEAEALIIFDYLYKLGKDYANEKNVIEILKKIEGKKLLSQYYGQLSRT